ncbi:MAG TPA: hypothetical protein VFX59_19005, partial [Polyangiales bacterium]|nr:hypothetical protein [Polyangiales bacterium]
MFAWLTRMFGGAEPQPRLALRVAAPTVNAKPKATPESKATKDSYLAKLAAQQPPPSALSPEDEQEVSALVEDISYFVGTHRIDPPVMPAVATRMLELTRQDEVDVHALARLIEKDQATAAK